MNKFYSLVIILVMTAWARTTTAQNLQLKPSIGIGALPSNNDAICSPVCNPNYDFYTDGLKVGDTIPQFQFYTMNGVAYDAQSLLSSGKPLCIVSASYTCPVWRDHIPDLNTLVATYGSQVNFLVVYTCEAHPMSPDISPYSCNVWNPSENKNQGVNYPQPTTYGQRRLNLKDMLNNACSCMPAINAPVVVDGPCNEFWNTFDHAPNCAFLVRPDNGAVYCKQGWFNRAPDDMGACIASLLTVLSVNVPEKNMTTEVFPNPANGQVIFSVSSPLPYSIEIYNVMGEKVITVEQVTDSQYVLPVSDLGAGTYFYRVVSGDHMVTNGKLLVQ